MKSVTKSNALFALMVFVDLVFMYVISVIPVSLTSDITMPLQQLILMLQAFVYIAVLKPDTSESIRFSLPDYRQLLLVVVIIYMTMPITALINTLTSLGTNSAGENIVNATASMPFWKVFLYVAVLPAICEEFLFRGLIYHGLRKRNVSGAVFMSALMFALMHMNINQFSYAFVLGVILALAVEITGSVLTSVIMHLLFNGTSIVSSYLLAPVMDKINIQAVENTETAAGRMTEIATYIYNIGVYAGILVIAICFLILAFSKLMKVSGKEHFMKENFTVSAMKTMADEGRYFDFFFLLGAVPALLIIIILIIT